MFATGSLPLQKDAGAVSASTPSNTQGILHIPSSAPSSDVVIVTSICLAGNPPHEAPLWRERLSRNIDLRDLEALRIRYQWWQSAAEAADGGLLWDTALHDKVRLRIMREVSQLLPFRAKLPNVVFDELSLEDAPHAGPSIIELDFADPDSLEIVSQHLREIHIDREASGLCSIFHLFARTNSVPGDIMRFDCQRLPLKASHIQDLFKTLEDMASNVGKLCGLVKLVGETESFDKMELGTIRGYIQLSPTAMLLPWNDFLALLFTHVQFNGRRYLLVYPGCCRKKAMRVFVKDTEAYGEVASQGETLSATASVSSEEGDTNAAAAESPSAAQ